MGFRSNSYNLEKAAAALKVDQDKLEAALKSNQVGGFARIWSVEDNGRYSVAKVSTSKKRRDGEGYETDFQSGFVRLVGKAHNKAQSIEVSEKGVGIQITNCEATTPYNAETKKGYNNYVIYDFDLLDNNASSGSAKKSAASKASKEKKKEVEEDDDDNDLPF